MQVHTEGVVLCGFHSVSSTFFLHFIFFLRLFSRRDANESTPMVYFISYSSINIMINIVANWTTSLNAAGIRTLAAPNGGATHGGFISPSSINATN
ncbi:hypothetical protein BJ165DRAFT_1510092 [Panaeolus papilionaceus]|nr:hypothetical protein BJ165DRAFT_1510092 [Panaeolus papilionaceus]